MPAPAVTVRRTAESARFVTVLYPFAEDRIVSPAPRLLSTGGPGQPRSLHIAGVGEGGAMADHLCWSSDPVPMQLGDWRLSARIGWLRTDGLGRPLRMAAHDVRESEWFGPGRAPETTDGGDGWRLLA